LLVNMGSLDDVEKFKSKQSLAGNAMHGYGQAPSEYGLKYIPHKVLLDKEGKIVKNFEMSLPADLDALLGI